MRVSNNPGQPSKGKLYDVKVKQTVCYTVRVRARDLRDAKILAEEDVMDENAGEPDDWDGCEAYSVKEVTE